MSFQWLNMRIAEEKERRERKAVIEERLPRALDELYGELQKCVEDYRQAFGVESAEICLHNDGIRVMVSDERTGQWQQRSQVQVMVVPALPGFRIENGKEPALVEMGTLPGDKLFFKYQEQYLTVEQMTRMILDPALFPDLAE